MQIVLEKQDLFEPFTSLSDDELAQTQFHCHEQPQQAEQCSYTDPYLGNDRHRDTYTSVSPTLQEEKQLG